MRHTLLFLALLCACSDDPSGIDAGAPIDANPCAHQHDLRADGGALPGLHLDDLWITGADMHQTAMGLGVAGGLGAEWLDSGEEIVLTWERPARSVRYEVGAQAMPGAPSTWSVRSEDGTEVSRVSFLSGYTTVAATDIVEMRLSSEQGVTISGVAWLACK